jgi:hypothetical protein
MCPAPWNKGRLVGQKPLREVWAIRIRLQILNRTGDIALFNLTIDSKLRSCDLVRLRVADVAHAGRLLSRATVLQRNTHSLIFPQAWKNWDPGKLKNGIAGDEDLRLVAWERCLSDDVFALQLSEGQASDECE